MRPIKSAAERPPRRCRNINRQPFLPAGKPNRQAALAPEGRAVWPAKLCKGEL